MRTLRALLLLSAVMLPGSLRASLIVFDNTGVPNHAVPDEVTFLVYASFSTGASGGTLSGVDLVLRKSNPASTTDIQVGIYSTTNGTFNAGGYTGPGPDTYLRELGFIDYTNVPLSQGTVSVDLTADIDGNLLTPMTLDPNTRYWIGVHSGGGTGGRWFYAADDSGVGAAGEFYGWFDPDAYVFSNSAGGFKMRITLEEAAAVPEPDTLYLGGAVLLLAIGRRIIARRLPAPHA